MTWPPDLRNCFERSRPVLNSKPLFDVLGIDEIEREEKEENSDGFRGNGKKDEAFVHKKQSSNGVVESGSSSGNEHENHSLSKDFLISGYNLCDVYGSPSLDTTDAFGDSVCKEKKEKELGNFSINRSDSKEFVGETVESEGLTNCNISLRDNEQEKQPLSEIQGPSESPSLLSEPIDIRNWFSSYVYESPVFDTNDGFGDFVCKENKSRKDRFLVVDLQSEGLAKCVSSGRDNKQDRKPVSEGHRSGVNENLPSQNDLYCKHMPKPLQNHVMATAQENSEAKFHAEVNCLLIQGDAELIPVKGASERKPTHGSKDRKDDGKEISEDGFIRTRKHKLPRKSYENIVEGPQEISKATATLADATNFHHSPLMEITGKWKCPQKSKPNLGPPLKQLRLEKWVRKM
ncbi:hypothetical protein ACE6H2_014534 [Prunus campanulata]